MEKKSLILGFRVDYVVLFFAAFCLGRFIHHLLHENFEFGFLVNLLVGVTLFSIYGFYAFQQKRS